MTTMIDTTPHQSHPVIGSCALTGGLVARVNFYRARAF